MLVNVFISSTQLKQMILNDANILVHTGKSLNINYVNTFDYRNKYKAK